MVKIIKYCGRIIIKNLVSFITYFGTNGPLFFKRAMAIALESINNVCLVRTPHGFLKITVCNQIEQWRVNTFFTKEPETISWLEKTISPKSVLYDIGANIGLYSLYAAHLFPKEVQVVSFEPESLNFSRLNQNIYLNTFNKNITSFCVCLDAQSGISKFPLSDFKVGCALHNRKLIKPGEEAYLQGCITYTLDDFITSSKFLPFPTHIKIDVDGTELEILKGAINTLKSSTLRHVLIELSQEDKDEAIKLLLGFNFKLMDSNISPDETIGNYIFYRHV